MLDEGARRALDESLAQVSMRAEYRKIDADIFQYYPGHRASAPIGDTPTESRIDVVCKCPTADGHNQHHRIAHQGWQAAEKRGARNIEQMMKRIELDENQTVCAGESICRPEKRRNQH